MSVEPTAIREPRSRFHIYHRRGVKRPNAPAMAYVLFSLLLSLSWTPVVLKNTNYAAAFQTCPLLFISVFANLVCHAVNCVVLATIDCRRVANHQWLTERRLEAMGVLFVAIAFWINVISLIKYYNIEWDDQVQGPNMIYNIEWNLAVFGVWVLGLSKRVVNFIRDLFSCYKYGRSNNNNRVHPDQQRQRQQPSSDSSSEI